MNKRVIIGRKITFLDIEVYVINLLSYNYGLEVEKYESGCYGRD